MTGHGTSGKSSNAGRNQGFSRAGMLAAVVSLVALAVGAPAAFAAMTVHKHDTDIRSSYLSWAKANPGSELSALTDEVFGSGYYIDNASGTTAVGAFEGEVRDRRTGSFCAQVRSGEIEVWYSNKQPFDVSDDGSCVK